MADQHAADRPHQIADREYAECRKQLGDRIFVREEVTTNLYCKITVDRKIVPFEHIADHSGRNHPAYVREVHLAPQGSARECPSRTLLDTLGDLLVAAGKFD